MVTIAITGHRPEDAESEDIVRIKGEVKLRTSSLDITSVITGMAAGTDLWLADEALMLGIPVTAAVPYKGHTARVSDEELYAHILTQATEIIYVSDSETYPGPWVYQKRNEWMVDHADAIMAYLNPNKQKGGTYNCYQYAKEQGKPIANIWYDPPF